MNDNYRIESLQDIETYLARLKYALDSGAKIYFQLERHVDQNRNPKCTNKYTIAYLFPNENPTVALKRELKKLTARNYLRTVKDINQPHKSEMREFGKVYNISDEIYIKIRVELLNSSGLGQHTFVMSFHFAEKPFSKEVFPYQSGGFV